MKTSLTRVPYVKRRNARVDAETVAGRLRTQDFKRLVRDFREARLSHLALQCAAARRGGKIASLLEAHGTYWWHFYDLKFSEHIALMCVGLGWSEKLKEIARADNPPRAFLEFAAKDDERGENPLDRMPSEGQAAFLNLLFGVFHSIEAICYYGLSVHELLDQASRGKTERLLWAVSIDRNVLCCDKASQILAMKQIQGDKAFFSGLFKRIKNPHVGRKQYVELRYFRRVMAEAGTLADTPKERLLDLVEKLGVNYPRGADPVKSLTVLFNAWELESTSRI